MKILFSLCCLLLVASVSQAQIVRIDTVTTQYVYKKPQNSPGTRAAYSYTVAVKGLSIEQFPKILNQTDEGEFIYSKFNGLMFKFNDNQISYRFTGNFFNEKISFKNDCMDCEQTNGKLNDFSIKMGFEKNIIYSRIQPYFGADIGYRRNKFEGGSENAAAIAYTVPYTVAAEKNSAVFGPFIGIKFNLTEHFSIGAESGMDVLYSYESQEKSVHDANRTRTFQKYYKFEFLTKPLAFLSLQYNFGLEY